MRNRSPANKRGLVAAGAGADFEDDVALVHRVLGQQREADLLLERLRACPRARASRLRHVAHLGVGRGIGDQRFEVGDLGRDAAIGLDLLDHGAELGEFARQLDEGLRRQLARQLGLDRGMAGEQRVEFLFAAASMAYRRQAFGRGEGGELLADRDTAGAGFCDQRLDQRRGLAGSRDRAASP